MPELDQSIIQLPDNAEDRRVFFLGCAEYYGLRTSRQQNCSAKLAAMQKECGQFETTMWITCWEDATAKNTMLDFLFAALDHPAAWQSLITAKKDGGLFTHFASLMHATPASITFTEHLNFNHFEHIFAQKIGYLISAANSITSRVDEVLTQLVCDVSAANFSPALTTLFETHCSDWLCNDSKEFQNILSAAAKKMLTAFLTNPVLCHLSILAQLGSRHAFYYLANFFVALSNRFHDCLTELSQLQQDVRDTYRTVGAQHYALPLVFLFHCNQIHIEKPFGKKDAADYQKFVLEKIIVDLQALITRHPSTYHKKMLMMLSEQPTDDSQAEAFDQHQHVAAALLAPESSSPRPS